MDSLKKFFRSSILTSAILMVLGVLLIFRSEFTIMTIAYIIGAILISIGALAIVKFVKNIKDSKKNELDVIYGLGTIILGVLVIKNHQTIASIIPFVIGIAIIISSTTKLQYALELKEKNNSQWKITMIMSIISVACGLVLIFNPFKGAVLITRIVGVFIVIYGILDIISTITIKKNVATIQKAIEGEMVDAEVVDEENIDDEPKKKKIR